jgi:DNA-binding CsgD family transcriptional regulator
MLASVCALESDSRWSARDPDSERSEGYCHSALSRREREVVWLVADGRTNEEIAERLCISLRTAKNHMSNIMRKIGTRNRTELASIFWRNEMSRTASQQPSQSLRHAS